MYTSVGYSVHWGTPCFMSLISMAWEPEDGGSARNAIFTMLSSAADSFAFLRLRVGMRNVYNDVFQTERKRKKERKREG